MPQQQLRWHNWPLCPAHPLISLATSANGGTVCPMEVTEALGVENSSHTTEMLWESHRWGSSWWYLPQGAMRGILDWEVDASGSNSDLSVLRAKVSYAVPVKLSCANAQSGLVILLGFFTFSIPSYLCVLGELLCPSFGVKWRLTSLFFVGRIGTEQIAVTQACDRWVRYQMSQTSIASKGFLFSFVLTVWRGFLKSATKCVLY